MRLISQLIVIPISPLYQIHTDYRSGQQIKRHLIFKGKCLKLKNNMLIHKESDLHTLYFYYDTPMYNQLKQFLYTYKDILTTPILNNFTRIEQF